MASSSSSRCIDQDLAVLIVQFLDEHKFGASARTLEKETKAYFNMKYVEEAVTKGFWEELEAYILSFTKIDDNQLSVKMLFEIRKQKYLEAVNNSQPAKALDILTNELDILAAHDKEIYKEIADLIHLKNIRDNEKLAEYYKDRRSVFVQLKQMIEMNPVLKDKLKYPSLEDKRLKKLMDHSINWQHTLCEYPHPKPIISTLYVDHTCGDALTLSLNNDVDRQALGTFTPGNTDQREVSNINPVSDQPAQLESWRLLDPISSSKGIDKLTFSNSGHAIIALTGCGVFKFWKWEETNATGKATPRVEPKNHKGLRLLANDSSPGEHELVVPFLALSKNDVYVASAAPGGKVSLLRLQESEIKTLATFMSSPPAATCVLFYPDDNNYIIIGMEDGSIQIYDARTNEVKASKHDANAHTRRITGFAYSRELDILVSSGYDAQICAWNKFALILEKRKSLDNYDGVTISPANTFVKFHPDQKHMLVFHDSCIATFEGRDLQPCMKWIPEKLIRDAAYSCDGQTIYVSFAGGHIAVLNSASFTLRCTINPCDYMPLNLSSSVVNVGALATHPKIHNQFALGLDDGGVIVVETLEGDRPGSRLQSDNVVAESLEGDRPGSSTQPDNVVAAQVLQLLR